MTAYSSKDFATTHASLKVDVPEKLLHANVTGGEGATAFSAERRHPVHVVDLPSKTISMTIGGLEPGQTTNRHRHTYETLIYILEGEGRTTIEDVVVKWRAGDALYIPVWAWHHHTNASSEERCLYVACENMPLLANLGGLAIRAELHPPEGGAPGGGDHST
jgi:quercetin dioxygenase-like cupin family protein